MKTAPARILTGLLIAPCVPGLLLFLVLLLTSQLMAGLVLLLIPIAYGVALIMGVPAVLMLHKAKVSNIAAYLLSGVVIGLVSGIVASLCFNSLTMGFRHFMMASLGFLIIAVVYALISMAIFWLVGISAPPRY